MQRRLLCFAATGLLCGSWPLALAQSPPGKHIGIVSLLGDGVEVTVVDSEPTDTRIDRGRRETYDFPKIGFDLIATNAAKASFEQARPDVKLTVFGTNTNMPAAEQRSIARSAHDGALPAWLIKVIQDRKLSHVLLITRQRADVSLRTGEGEGIGRSKADGIGFYLDSLFEVRNRETGAIARGALGPHVFIELTLMDTDTAKVVHSHTVRDQWLVGPKDYMSVTDPWSFLTPAEKIKTLRDALDRNLRRVLPDFARAI
jgi:hypothetical protein